MRVLPPGIQAEQSSEIRGGRRIVATFRLIGGELMERVQRPVPQVLALGRRPLVEVGRVAHIKAIQKVAGVEADRLPQPPVDADAGHVGLLEQGEERLGIEVVGAAGLKATVWRVIVSGSEPTSFWRLESACRKPCAARSSGISPQRSAIERFAGVGAPGHAR